MSRFEGIDLPNKSLIFDHIKILETIMCRVSFYLNVLEKLKHENLPHISIFSLCFKLMTAQRPWLEQDNIGHLNLEIDYDKNLVSEVTKI